MHLFQTAFKQNNFLLGCCNIFACIYESLSDLSSSYCTALCHCFFYFLFQNSTEMIKFSVEFVVIKLLGSTMEFTLVKDAR